MPFGVTDSETSLFLFGKTSPGNGSDRKSRVESHGVSQDSACTQGPRAHQALAVVYNHS